MALLELTDVEAAYGHIRALHGVSLKVEEGSLVALLGANGAGKTTTLRSISGTVKRSGEISFAGKSIARSAPEDVARLGIAHVPEGRGILAQLSVWDNLQMGAYVRRDRANIKKDYERVIRYFPWIAQRRQQIAATLSGGEQQMLGIARALMMKPRLMLLDEPSLGLAPVLVREIYEMIQTINRDDGVTVLAVEQNATLALRAAAHAYVLEAGRVAISGTSQELARNESVRKSYLGY